MDSLIQLLAGPILIVLGIVVACWVLLFIVVLVFIIKNWRDL